MPVTELKTAPRGEKALAPERTAPVVPPPELLPNSAKPEPGQVARALRRQRTRRFVLSFALWIGAPTLLSAVYYCFLATRQYESAALFTVSSLEPARGGANSLESLAGGISALASGRDTLSVRDYILSREALSILEQKAGFIAHFRSKTADPLSRLAEDATFEEAFEYYPGRVEVEEDMLSGLLTLKVRAFSAESAKRFSEVILESSERMVNRMSEKARADRVEFARQQLAVEEQRLAAARKRVLDLQQQHGEFNPAGDAVAALTIRSGLEAELARARAELMQAEAFMHPDAAMVRTLTERVKAISAQVAKENRRLVDPRGDKAINSSMAEFEGAMVEKEFAQHTYQVALNALEQARIDAARQQRYLAIVAAPSMADEATYPKRVFSILTVFACSLLIFGIGSLLVATVKEHARL
jgi:capsular polysaccharide transport system permease protein